MKIEIKKPPDGPTGDVAEWRRQRQDYVNASWEPYLKESASEEEECWLESHRDATSVESNECVPDESATEKKIAGKDRENTASNDEDAPIIGDLRPWVAEGERVMVCIAHKVLSTRYGPKVYLYWREKIGSPILEQFFPHYDKYPVNSKAVQNYIVAMGGRPDRLDRMSFRRLIGLEARVYVETVKPLYSAGALKGREKPEANHYSKVSEILARRGQVDANTLRELREESL